MKIGNHNYIYNKNNLSDLKINIANLSNQSELVKQNSIKFINIYIKQFIQKYKNKKNKKELFMILLKKENIEQLSIVEELFDDIWNSLEVNNLIKKEERNLESLKSAKNTKNNKKTSLLNAKIIRRKINGGE